MINYDLTKIRAIIFDVDGVLSHNTVNTDEQGNPLRTINIKDGYAIQLAVKMGLRLAIMTGGRSDTVEQRYRYLGLQDIFMGCSVKVQTYEAFKQQYGLSDAQLMYMGDDIPDLEVMRRVGCPVCPADACPEVQEQSLYISHVGGGDGCARDVIEQVLRAQGLWMKDARAFGW
ncbi:MAG: HAD-IIIA family hydrolase [Prevotella sp.]|nr:HAD-IIIA family hydrolase [Prevotella sp.]